MHLSNFFKSEVFRTNRNLFIVNLTILGMTIWALYGSRYYLQNFFYGPYVVDGQFLENVQDPASAEKQYLTVAGQDLIDTGIYKYTEKNGVKSTIAEYLILKIDQKLLLVKHSPSLEKAKIISGSLISIPHDVQAATIDKLVSEHPQLSGRFYPLMLSDESYRGDGWFGLAVAAFFISLSSFNLWKAASRARNVSLSPVVASLQRYGNPVEVSAIVDGELGQFQKKIGKKTRLTKSWLIKSSAFATDVVRLDKIAWAYQHVTKHSVNFVPTGKTFKVILKTHFGEEIDVELTNADCVSLLKEINSAAPWIPIGYTADLQNLWKNKRRDFLNAVDSRRNRAG